MASTVTTPLNEKELPDEWLKYAVAIGIPEHAARGEWVNFRFYWASGKGGGTRRSARGWGSTWQTWIRKQAASGSFVAQPDSDTPVDPIKPPPDEFMPTLTRVIDRQTIYLWFGRCEFKSGPDGAMHVKAPSRFVADWITRNYASAIAAFCAMRIYLPSGKIWFDSHRKNMVDSEGNKV